MPTTKCKDDLRDFVEQLAGKYTTAECDPLGAGAFDASDPAFGVFVYSFLIWETTGAKANGALKKLEESVVDANELRVCLPDEMVRFIGERYPRSQERCARLKAALNDIYQREHHVGLSRVAALGKREARDYLESIEGVPGFVSSRVLLLTLGGHAAPVDGRIAGCLAKSGYANKKDDPETIASQLERNFRAKELTRAYGLIQAWCDDGGPAIGAGATSGEKTKTKSTSTRTGRTTRSKRSK